MNLKKLIRSRLNIKLFLAFLIVVVVGAIVLITAVEFIMPTAFESHLLFMQNALNDPAKTEQALNDDLFFSFRSAVYNAMKFAIPSSLIAALVISLTFSQQFINQIKKMLSASKKISNGDFQERIALPRHVSPDEMDELQQLAIGFNQMTEKLDKNEQLRKELIGDVSHELRTPLAFIKASIESIADGVITPSAEILQDIQEEINRLTRLVDDLQELSIIEAGSYVLDKKKVTVDELIIPLANQMQSRFKENGIQFSLEVGNDLPAINVDVDRIKQVLTNIISNTIRFTPNGGRVELIISRENRSSIVFAIRDTGIGIPRAQLGKIFTRFYRVDKSRSREGGGSGVGLTIAKQLVEAHGGRIWAESAGKNKGTTITFTLPVA
jgi:signal transduction histidine kinase